MTRSEAGRLGALKAAPILKQKSLDKYYLNPNICQYCNNIIKVGDNERPSATKRKRFCDSSCSSKYNNSKRKTKKCLICDIFITKNLTYCSQVCFNEHKRQKTINRLQCNPQLKSKNNKTINNKTINKKQNYTPGHRTIRRILMEQQNNKCSKCGWGEINPKSGKVPLILNHIDGNSTNYNFDNLEILCPNCDSLTPTYKALNKGNGRTSRMTRYHEGKSY